MASKWVRGCALALLGMASAYAAEASENPQPASLIVPELPGWITPPRPLPKAPALSPSNPLRMMIVEQQVNVSKDETFCHYALRVESEGGLQQAGQIALNFAPTYEQLRWHYLRVWHNGEKRDRLTAEGLQVLRQEEDAERFVYHGRLNALAVLRDLRVGDTIEYAFTRVGRNPVFGGRYSTSFSAAFSVPADVIYYRLIAAASRPMRIATLGTSPLIVSTHDVGDQVEHEWNATNVPAIRAMSDAPGWEVQYPFVQVSEFQSWTEVAEWGRRLFDTPATIGAQLRERIQAITAAQPNLEAKANAVVRFVQDEIRYLGISIGESSHRPFAPDEVLERRFGDCKDKSLLLVTLLRELGLKAEVALVHSDLGPRIADFQPSPLAFDHAIVHVTLPQTGIVYGGQGNSQVPSESSIKTVFKFNPLAQNNPAKLPAFAGATTDIWLDATCTLQGGNLRSHWHGNFGYALLLAPDTHTLTPIRHALEAGSEVWVQEKYESANFTAPARLEVKTTYRGGMADYYRSVRGSSDPVAAARQLTGTISRFFPKVRYLGGLTWTDDRERNVLESVALYEVPEFWTVDATGKERRLEVYPWGVSERLPRPEAVDRTCAFNLPFPYAIRHDIELNLPKKWPVTGTQQQIDDNSFSFSTTASSHERKVYLGYTWKVLDESVAPSRMSEWAEKMTKVRNALGYQLTQNIALAAALEKPPGLVWSLALALGAGIAAGSAIGFWLYRRRPKKSSQPPLLPGALIPSLGGALVLAAIGIVLRPIMSGYGCIEIVQLAFEPKRWITLTATESGSFIPGFAALVMAEGFLAAFFLGWSLVLVPQFFQRKATLPTAVVIYLGAFAAWAVVHTFWMRAVPLSNSSTVDADLANVGRNVLVLIFWVPYFLTSHRVKETFIA